MPGLQEELEHDPASSTGTPVPVLRYALGLIKMHQILGAFRLSVDSQLAWQSHRDAEEKGSLFGRDLGASARVLGRGGWNHETLRPDRTFVLAQQASLSLEAVAATQLAETWIERFESFQQL